MTGLVCDGAVTVIGLRNVTAVKLGKKKKMKELEGMTALSF
jgi:hypothetical protein